LTAGLSPLGEATLSVGADGSAEEDEIDAAVGISPTADSTTSHDERSALTAGMIVVNLTTGLSRVEDVFF
jgi:hypothetical protein